MCRKISLRNSFQDSQFKVLFIYEKNSALFCVQKTLLITHIFEIMQFRKF